MDIQIAISSCLLGESVRFNGGHKHSHFCTDVLGQYFSFKPVCPEVGIGMGIPRPPIRLIASSAGPQAVGVEDPTQNFTAPLTEYARQKSAELAGISGYILMQKSPSCGYERVKLYRDNGYPADEAAMGIYAAEFARLNPLLPMEEAGRLNDAMLRENFITRVFAYADWQALQQTGLTKKTFLDFHVRYKYLMMAHHVATYQQLGQMVADLKSRPLADIAADYFVVFMQGLKHLATRKKHSNVLYHLQGYLKEKINARQKQELNQHIEQYRKGLTPLVVPLTLLKSHLHEYPDTSAYVLGQKYLDPHPYELGLRNAI
ncbi:MAG: DUF1722 domain-containing protein [Oceanospirillaceae bacterium]|nr:DUF1722 domain-containing protein [Oceanospirillaceae bacterium]MCP5335497.1 DUF1722 domain-containing protein [Oceanospirillaceae bacterium]MCP5349968.1 DUF1722 domain-containing protein [Oceanospirillaceae bacterium]